MESSDAAYDSTTVCKQNPSMHSTGQSLRKQHFAGCFAAQLQRLSCTFESTLDHLEAIEFVEFPPIFKIGIKENWIEREEQKRHKRNANTTTFTMVEAVQNTLILQKQRSLHSHVSR